MKDMRLFKSFKYATRGLVRVFQSELSFRIQVFVSLAVVFLMFAYPVSGPERIVLTLLIGAVLTLEIINTIFERIVDAFKPRVHPVVGEIKDMMAAAVLVASIISAAIGILIFWPFVVG